MRTFAASLFFIAACASALVACERKPAAPDVAAPIATTTTTAATTDAAPAPADAAATPADAAATPADTAPAPADSAPADVAAAEPIDDSKPLALWPAVERGKLDNGLTWYVMKHGNPKGRALLWLAVNAGSMQEDDDQKGLAHFLEHMAFNGTARFPKHAIIDYLEKIGMKFGPDLNAYTSFDETVFQLGVPTDDPGFLAKGLDVLRDWAGDITLDEAEVTAERGVVHEEWRLGRGAFQRLYDKHQRVVFAGSRYGERLPIGDPKIILGATRETLARFYKDWYRPELMAVVVVGDVDPTTVKAAIAERFGSLASPSAARPRPRGEVPSGTGVRVSIASDAELELSNVIISDLVAHRPESTGNDLRRSVVEQVWQHVLNERLAIVARKPDAPIKSAGVGVDGVTREIDALQRVAWVNGDRVEDALRLLATEVARLERHGASAAELERARADIAEAYRQYVLEERTADASEYAAEITRNFFEGELMIGRKSETEHALRFLPTVTLADINAVTGSFGGGQPGSAAPSGGGGGDHRVVELSLTDDVKAPTEERVRAILAEVDKADIGPWQDERAAAPLMAGPPTPAAGAPAPAITVRRTLDAIGTTEWTLSNGIVVVVKPTDFEDGSVALAGDSNGGYGDLPDADLGWASFVESALGVGGLGELDGVALGMALAGKRAGASTAISEARETIAASASPDDLETMFQLLWLRVTAPRWDEAEVARWKRDTSESLVNSLRDPSRRFAIELGEELAGHHPRERAKTPADVEAVTKDKALALHQARFGDMSDFTFVIVGAVDLAKLEPLVVSYLGALPTAGRKEPERSLGMRIPGGKRERTWRLGKEPVAHVHVFYTGAFPWTRDDDRDMFILASVLRIRLLDVLREELGGTYSPSVSGMLTRPPDAMRRLGFEFGCDPANVDKLLAAMNGVIAAVKKDGPTADELDKIKAGWTRTREVQLRTNGFWMSWLASAWHYGDDPLLVLDPTKLPARATVDNVKAAAQRFLADDNVFKAVLLPE